MTITDQEKTAIICLYKKGQSMNNIADLLTINRHTVALWTRRCNSELENKRKPGSGRKTKITNKIIIDVMEQINQNIYFSLKELHEHLKINLKMDITLYLLRKIISDSKFEYGFPPLRFPLTDLHKKKRLEFAVKYKNLDWKSIIFTDEIAYWLFSKQIERWYNPDNIYDIDITYKHPSKLNAWGAISYDKKIIHVFDQTMNADIYVNILKTNLKNIYEADNYLIYDNDPKHTSAKAKTYLTNNEINILDFPPCSPDINPIENIWAIYKHNIAKINPKNIDQLKQTMLTEWNNIDQEIIRNSIDSMPVRLQKIIIAKGSYID